MNQSQSQRPPSRLARAMAWDSVRYSAVWEDHRLVTEALRIGPQDDVLSITSAGTNVLAILLEEPATVTAVDINPAQTALLELKIAGIRALSHAEFLVLVGVVDGEPERLYLQVRGQLSASAAAFWDANVELIRRGAFRCGRLDQYFHQFRTEHLAKLWPADLAPRLFACDTLEAQVELFEREAWTPEFRDRFVWFFGREMMERRGRDPEQFRFVEDGRVGEYFLGRFYDVCTRLPLRDNFYVERFVTGGYSDLQRVPLYLRAPEFERLRHLVDRVELVTEELEVLLEQRPRAFDKANLSDVFEYMAESEADAAFELLAQAMRPGGRIAYWNLLVPRGRPERLADRLVPLEDESHRLWLSDRAWFYRAFRVDEVSG